MTGTRVLTALILIPIVIALVLFTPTWAVALATAVITILALLLIGQQWFSPFYHSSVRSVLLLPLFDPAPVVSSFHQLVTLYSPETLFFLFVLGLTVLTLFTRRPLVESLPSAGISSSALLLVAFPLSYAVRLHGITRQGPRLLLFTLAITWAADTTAYFIGRSFGKHPLAPHISPKKTWEGSAGGLLGSLLIAYAFHYWLTIPIPHLLAMATLGNIAGQMGDLLESACKRSAGVKDSGRLLPGHGGILDRIDALILCIPVIWYYLVLVNPSL
jgi:phosphatidate cytidylyltransferase